MPPTISPAERKRLIAVRAANKLGVKCTYVVPVPKKKYVPPQLAVVPRPTKPVLDVLLEPVDENTIAQWASDDAKYHVFQASLNATRPINTKTTNPLPEFLPAQRKYFQGGVVQRTFKRQLSLAQDETYRRYYRHFLLYWKEVQADKPPTPKVDNLQKLPVKMGKLRIPEDRRTITSSVRYYYDEVTSAIGASHEFSSHKYRMAYMDDPKNTCFTLDHKEQKVYKGQMREEGGVFYYETITTTIIQEYFNSAAARQKYVDNPANSCYTLNEDGSKKYKGTFRDTAPTLVKDEDGEVVTKLKPIVYGTKPTDKWYNAAHEDLSSVKKDKDGVPFLESLDANRLHPVMFCEPVVTDLSGTVNAWNEQASRLKGE